MAIMAHSPPLAYAVRTLEIFGLHKCPYLEWTNFTFQFIAYGSTSSKVRDEAAEAIRRLDSFARAIKRLL